MCLIVLTSVTFAQSNLSNLEQKAVTKPIQLAQLSEQKSPPSPISARDCVNPKTGLPDQLVQCVVDPCQGFVPESPFETCTANYCGGCHAILCGVVLSDVSSMTTQ